MIGLSDGLTSARATLIRDALDAGTGPAVLTFYTSPRPARGAAVTTQQVVGAATFSQPCGSVVGASLVFDVITGSAATGEAPATWARAVDGDGAFVADFGVGAYGSGADIELEDVSPTAGELLTTSGAQSITEGNAA